MVTKEELEEEINSTLDTEMEWSQMKKDDLEKFNEMLDDEGFIKKVVAQYANDKVGDKAETQIENWQPGQFVKMAAAMQDDDFKVVDMFL